MKKKILFVSYGGGHIRLLTPVIKQLEKFNYDLLVIGLTTASSFLESKKIPYKSYKDYVFLFKNNYLKYGEKLLSDLDGVLINREETLAYLGLNYVELVDTFGNAEAERRYALKKRQAFLPIMTMKKIIDYEKPDLVITTNSPRSEQASVMAAKLLSIKTLTINDDLGNQAGVMSELLADYIAVASSSTKEILISKGVKPKHFFVTGNPNFDDAFNFKTFNSTSWKLKNLPRSFVNKKVITFFDQHAFLLNDKLFWRDEGHLLSYLNDIYEQAKINNAALLIRPHPSQSNDLYINWLKEKSENAILAKNLDLYPLIASSDCSISLTSTVLIQSLYVGKPIIQIKYENEDYDFDIYKIGLSYLAKNKISLRNGIKQAISENVLFNTQKEVFNKMFPQEPAVFKVLDVIKFILKT